MNRTTCHFERLVGMEANGLRLAVVAELKKLKMITKQKLNEALQLIADYEQQLWQTHVTSSAAWHVGCRVKLSKWGLEMQGRQKSKLRGTVIEVLEGAVQKTTDSTICVKWKGISKPDWMHVSQAEPVK